MAILLTSEQSKPVLSDCKINVCLACPGSGKTTVLISRAERLWQETKEPILIVTFSNDACKNIIKRIKPEIATGITIKTIHSFCYDIVKTYWKDLNDVFGKEIWPKEPTLLSKERELTLIGELYEKDNPSHLYDIFSYLRELNTEPEQLLILYRKKVYFDKIRQSDIEKFINYESIRLSKGLINFDDMILLADMLLPIPSVSIDLSRRFSHILVDEAQDTSIQQWRILRPMILNSLTSLIVGDFNQAIYGWRNADGSILYNSRQMKDAVTFRLSESFRSGSTIADIANKICHDKTSQIIPQSHLGKVSYHVFPSYEKESEWILSQTRKDMAIISRTNSYLERIERVCIERGLSYTGKSFYRSEHVLDLYSFLINLSSHDNLLTILDKAYIHNSSFTRHQVEDYKIIMKLIEQQGIQKFLELVSKSRTLDYEGITLITGHASKGLEWDTVFVIGCHNGHVPHKYSTDIREERNLLYVMTSRAKNNLIITCIDELSSFLPKDTKSGASNS